MTDDFFASISEHDHDRMRQLLSAQPDLASSTNPSGTTAVLHAAYTSNDEAIRSLLSLRPTLSVHEAAATGMVDHLDSVGPDDHGLSPDGWTPLHLASFFGHADAVRTLLDKGADVHARSDNDLNNHALHAAAAGGHSEVCEILLDHGADVNATQQGGSTPLHAAAQGGDSGLVGLLLDAGATPWSLTADGRRPADIAKTAGHDHLGDQLESQGAE